MNFIINLIVAILAFVAARLLLGWAGAGDPLNMILSVLIAVVVFLANPATSLRSRF